MPENFNVYFCVIFERRFPKFNFERDTEHYSPFPCKSEILPIFTSFPMSEVLSLSLTRVATYMKSSL